MGDDGLLAMWKARMAELHGLADYRNEPNAVPPPLAVMFASMRIAPLRRLYSWAVPSELALATIHRSSPHGVVEVGAGCVRPLGSPASRILCSPSGAVADCKGGARGLAAGSAVTIRVRRGRANHTH